MSKFLKRASSEEEQDEARSLEEQYEKLFVKIGRDFVYKEDLLRILEIVMRIIDPLGLTPLDAVLDIEAKKRALEYKAVLESGKDGTKLFRDLIKLDDD